MSDPLNGSNDKYGMYKLLTEDDLRVLETYPHDLVTLENVQDLIDEVRFLQKKLAKFMQELQHHN